MIERTEPGGAVQEGEVTGGLTVTKDSSDASPEPRASIAALEPGDHVLVEDTECRVVSTSNRVNYGQTGRYALGFCADAFGCVSTLSVDCDPYFLSFPGGSVYEIDPEDVQPVEKQ